MKVKPPRGSCCDRMSTWWRRMSPPIVKLCRPRLRNPSPPAAFVWLRVNRGKRVGQARDAAGEAEARRSPVHRFLVVAVDAGLARHVRPVREVRRRLRRLTRELIAQPHRHQLRDPMVPVHLRIDGRRAVLILEAEERVRVGRRPLVGHVAEDLIPLVDVLRETRLQAVLSHHGQDGHLVVVAAVALAGRLRIVAKQRRRPAG